MWAYPYESRLRGRLRLLGSGARAAAYERPLPFFTTYAAAAQQAQAPGDAAPDAHGDQDARVRRLGLFVLVPLLLLEHRRDDVQPVLDAFLRAGAVVDSALRPDLGLLGLALVVGHEIEDLALLHALGGHGPEVAPVPPVGHHLGHVRDDVVKGGRLARRRIRVVAAHLDGDGAALPELAGGTLSHDPRLRSASWGLRAAPGLLHDICCRSQQAQAPSDAAPDAHGDRDARIRLVRELFVLLVLLGHRRQDFQLVPGGFLHAGAVVDSVCGFAGLRADFGLLGLVLLDGLELENIALLHAVGGHGPEVLPVPPIGHHLGHVRHDAVEGGRLARLVIQVVAAHRDGDGAALPELTGGTDSHDPQGRELRLGHLQRCCLVAACSIAVRDGGVAFTAVRNEDLRLAGQGDCDFKLVVISVVVLVVSLSETPVALPRFLRIELHGKVEDRRLVQPPALLAPTSHP
eukprot:CAMPEP_0195155482 /NCGR_PEP_ID=MMETSP0448-20130528/184182_1 /TAXON_ID=66468 /ORGANISM="Heterocapsa triquestra, Strain CCMP 448" /LENGTH=460 /DNA_ID=CAMNT_0040194269 /DNA_START=308 /DNA_END=1689 /DNA_ORIENTATION=-